MSPWFGLGPECCVLRHTCRSHTNSGLFFVGHRSGIHWPSGGPSQSQLHPRDWERLVWQGKTFLPDEGRKILLPFPKFQPYSRRLSQLSPVACTVCLRGSDYFTPGLSFGVRNNKRRQLLTSSQLKLNVNESTW